MSGAEPAWASNIRLKRVYDPSSPLDGRRILATRYWPRGQPKAVTDEYSSKIAPSKALINEYRKGPLSWEEFTRRYREELVDPATQQDLKRLGAIAQSQTITLMCMCPDDWNCHRTILRRAIIDSMGE